MILRDILLAGAAQGFMLCVVVLSLYSVNALANRLLAGFIGLASLHLLLLYFIIDPRGLSLAFMAYLFPLRVLEGPALYLYACAITEPEFKLRPGLGLHLLVFLPPFIANLVLVRSVQLPAYDFHAGVPDSISRFLTALLIYHSLVIIAYATAALRQLSRHRYRLEQALSVMDGVSLNWLKVLLIGLIAMQGLHLVLNALRLEHVVHTLQPARFLNTFTTIVMIYLISLGGLRQPKVFTEAVCAALEGVGDRDGSPAVRRGGKYVRSGLSEERRREIWRQLQGLLHTQRVYLDMELSLPGLAQRLGIRPQELSETINTEYHGTFYELINFHRIEAAKALLQQPDAKRRKMLDVALSVGFSSLSTFYNQFRKFTQSTPTEYRRQSHGSGDQFA